MANGSIKTPKKLAGQIKPKQDIDALLTSGGGVSDHNKLTNKDAENQHPIAAITGLQEKLDLQRKLVEKCARGLYFDINKELDTKAFWYLTSEIDPITGQGTKASIVAGPYDLGAGGGGGSGSSITEILVTNIDPLTGNSMWPELTALDSDCTIKIYWSSFKNDRQTGNGTIYLYINNKLISNKVYEQGYITFDLKNYLIAGENKIEIKVVDTYSGTSNLIGTISTISLELKSNFNAKLPQTGNINYTYIPVGNTTKTIYFYLDGFLKGTQIVKSSNEQQSFLITGLVHGVHRLEVYFECNINGTVVRSNKLDYQLLYYTQNISTPLIASEFNQLEQEQYVSFVIPYRVFTPGMNDSNVELLVNGEIIKSLTVDQTEQLWEYRNNTPGLYTLTIRTANIEKSFSIHISASRVDIQAINENLVLNLSSYGRTNAEPVNIRNQWKDEDNNIECILSNFNFASDGWIKDTNGNTVLRVTGDARVEIPYKPFLRDFRNTGKTIEIELATSTVRNYDSMIIECLNSDEAFNTRLLINNIDERNKQFKVNLNSELFKAKVGSLGQYDFVFTNNGWTYKNEIIDLAEYGLSIDNTILSEDIEDDSDFIMEGDKFVITYSQVGRGFFVTPQIAKIQSQQSSLSTQYKEEDHVRLSFVIEKNVENRLVYMYINGIMSGAVRYPANDNFNQLIPQNIIIGSNDATVDIYSIRIYDNNLNRKQIVNNWIADTQDGALRAERFYHNDNYNDAGEIVINKLPLDLPHITFKGEVLPTFKGDKRNIAVEFTDLTDESKSFICNKASADVQGTSSQYYYRKNFKIKFSDGFIDNNGNTSSKYAIRDNAVKEKTFTFKADVASSEGANNVELVRFFEDSKHWYSPAEKVKGKDKIRVGIDGFPIVAFHDNGNKVSFYGKMNFNNDKGNKDTYGFESEWTDDGLFIDGDQSWEVASNTSDLVLFKSDDLSGDWKSSFESRYPDDNTPDEHTFGENPGELDRLQDMLTWVVSTRRLDTDTEEEKQAKLTKFKNEFEDRFDLQSALYYYLFTELFLMVDSRAKNAFPTYFKSRIPGDGGDRWFWIPYDMDTAIGINNEGLLVFNFDLEDTDIVNGAYVYNGQESVLWNNVRDCYQKELRALYENLRTGNAGNNVLWSFDNIEKRFEEHQSKWSETIFNEDSYTKCLVPLINNGDATYLGMLQGSKAEQRRWWLYNRFKYLDSKYLTGDAKNTSIMLRAYQKSNFNIVPYSSMYATAMFDSAQVSMRVIKDEHYLLESPVDWNPNNTDSVVGIYSADQLREIGDISGFKVGYADFSKAIKLQHLIIGNSSPDYKNEKLEDLNIGNNTMLQVLDVRNCVNLKKPVDISKCINIEEVYFDNTQVTSIDFPVGGILKKVHLPNTLTSLTLRNQPLLTELDLAGTEHITSLWLENIPSSVLNTNNFILSMTSGASVRLIGIDQMVNSVSEIINLYNKLDTMKGIDAFGNETDITAAVTGKISISEISYSDYILLKDRYKGIKINAQRIICTVNFYNENALYQSQNILLGKDAVKPIDPEKPATQQYYYTFSSWDKSLNNIQSDMNIYAIYEEHIQVYTVSFDSQSDVIVVPNQLSIEYGNYISGPTLWNIPEGVDFLGWYLKSGIKFDFNTPIHEDIILLAKWNDQYTPSSSIYRSDYKTLIFECQDNMGITGWSLTNSSDLPAEWNRIDPMTFYSDSYTLNSAGHYFLHVIDAQGNTSYSDTYAYNINKNISNGVIITLVDTKNNIILNDDFAIASTPLQLSYTLDSHYENLVVELNGSVINNLHTFTLEADCTLRAYCTPKKYDIVFNLRGKGEAIPTQQVAYLEKVNSVAPQFAEGEIIDGWYTDAALTQEWNFDTDRITGHMTLYAKWIEYNEPTFLYITIPEDNTTIELNYSQTVSNGVLVNFGDSLFEKSSETGFVTLRHSYEQAGSYIISLSQLNGLYYLGKNYEQQVINPISYLTAVKFSWDTPYTNVYAFKGAVNLTNLNLTQYMSKVETGAFMDCTGLTSLVLPKTLLTINSNAFSNCTNIEGELVIPDFCTKIDNAAFSNCSKISSIVFGANNNLKIIGEGAFSKCSSLINLQLPENVEAIKNNAFAECDNLETVTIPESVACLEKNIFRLCTNLSNVELKNPALIIGGGCFDGCTQLLSAGPIADEQDYNIKFAWVDAIPDNAFNINYSYNTIETIVLPETIKSIGNNAFANTNITSIDLPIGLLSLGESVFSRTNLISLSIPNTVTSIGNNCFEYNLALNSLELHNTQSTNKIDYWENSWVFMCPYVELKVNYLLDPAEAQRRYGLMWNYSNEDTLLDVSFELLN